MSLYEEVKELREDLNELRNDNRKLANHNRQLMQRMALQWKHTDDRETVQTTAGRDLSNIVKDSLEFKSFKQLQVRI